MCNNNPSNPIYIFCLCFISSLFVCARVRVWLGYELVDARSALINNWARLVWSECVSSGIKSEKRKKSHLIQQLQFRFRPPGHSQQLRALRFALTKKSCNLGPVVVVEGNLWQHEALYYYREAKQWCHLNREKVSKGVTQSERYADVLTQEYNNQSEKIKFVYLSLWKVIGCFLWAQFFSLSVQSVRLAFCQVNFIQCREN